MAEPKTIEQLLETAELVMADSTNIFEDHDNRQEAVELMAHVLEVDDEDDFDMDEVLPPAKRNRFLALAARRAAGEPFPFLVGHIVFYGIELKVRPGPFVPRPSSELTVERVLKRLKKTGGVFVDVATGAGPIALAVALELPEAEVWGADIDASGIAQARENAKLLELDNVQFKVSDMYDSLPNRLKGKVDVISGHVPYVPAAELEDLPREVRGYEPVHTLSDQSADGLTLMKRAISESTEWLKPGGWLLLEVSDDLIGKIQKLTKRSGFEDRGVADDDDGLSVVVESQLKQS